MRQALVPSRPEETERYMLYIRLKILMYTNKDITKINEIHHEGLLTPGRHRSIIHLRLKLRLILQFVRQSLAMNLLKSKP